MGLIKNDNKGQVKRRAISSKDDLKKMIRPMRPRDNISGDFAGYENKGPAKHQKLAKEHGTKVKNRFKAGGNHA